MMTQNNLCCLLVTAISLLSGVGCAEKIDTPEEFLQVAYRHERSAELPQAIAAYKQSIQLNERQPTVWYDLGVAYAAIEQFPDAVAAYSKSAELDSNSARTFNNRAAAYARLKQYKNAIDDCSRAVALDPNDFLAWRNRGLARHDNGELEEAISDYDESIRINGKAAETYHYRGNVFLDRKLWSRALEDFDQAILLDSRMSAAWLSRAISLARLGRREDAEKARSKAQELGNKVDDVIIADLLPAADVAPYGGLELRQQAVQFVQTELTKAGQLVQSAAAPWDLLRKSGDVEERLVIRLVTVEGDDSAVNFSASDLKQFLEQPGPITLIGVRQLSDSASGDSTVFRIVTTIPQWAPDTAKMQPVEWSLPISEKSVASAVEPVLSAD